MISSLDDAVSPKLQLHARPQLVRPPTCQVRLAAKPRSAILESTRTVPTKNRLGVAKVVVRRMRRDEENAEVLRIMMVVFVLLL